MKETEKRRGPKNKERVRPARPDTRDHKQREKNAVRNLIPNRDMRASSANEAMASADGVKRSEETSENPKMDEKESNEILHDNPSNWESESRDGTVDESDPETINDSVSSQGDSQTADEDKAEKVSRVSKNLLDKASQDTPIKVNKSDKGPLKSTVSNTSADTSRNMKVHPKPLLEFSEGADDQPLEQEKEADTDDLDVAPNCAHSACTDDEEVNTDENDEKDSAALDQKIEEMEAKVKQLESELREVAALEIALYSVVPEHSSSAHKVHTPARRLSRLYIFACKYWSQEKRATVARNTVSGLVLVAKSCGNDVSRLTFWLSNTVVLREIISQAFGSSCQSSPLAKIFESNEGGKKRETKASSFKWKSNNGSRQLNKQGFLQFVDDWQETRTFTAALEKIESWMFSRIVESIWWQTLTPNMQSALNDSTTSKASERLLGPALGDQKQGNFSINLWKNAFHDALKRLCPVRAGGHECGCLPVLARKVMEQCIGRLDVAMFNAILRESVHEIPTDPISDPIVDSKVLPIPAGDLSFGSGAQLKNSVGNWERWLTDFLGGDADFSAKDKKNSSIEVDNSGRDKSKCFPLLNALSDLLMLPKDMLMDQTIRMEVCPSISLPLVKRVLCNFTPDEFCPDSVPGAVLEAVNAECITEHGLSASSFPYPAAPVVYTPPSSSDVAEKVLEAGENNSHLSRSSSAVQRKGYTSDEELNELESCPTSIIDKLASSPGTNGNGDEEIEYDGANARYELLREVWLAT